MSEQTPDGLIPLVSLRITKEQTPVQVSNTIFDVRNLYTKLYLISQDHMNDLFDYAVTHNPEYDSETGLTIARSPINETESNAAQGEIFEFLVPNTADQKLLETMRFAMESKMRRQSSSQN